MNRSAITAKVLEIVKRQRLFNDAVASAPEYPRSRFHGRGIVICGGGDVYFPCAWVCIRMLRSLGCRLPVELWYRGPREMNAAMIELMGGLGAVCVDAFRVARTYPILRLDSWELKPFAIANSAFEEVLFLDADNVPMQNPEVLFDSPEYLQDGTIFWPDRWPGSGREWLRREAWTICGVPYRLEAEIESGQMLIDKRRCWQALHLALHLNEQSNFYYEYFHGDKDTFHLAWRRMDTPYALAPHPPRTLGDCDTIVQFDFSGAVLFQHRNGDKWSTVRLNRRIAGFLKEQECFAYLQELRELWLAPVRRFPEDFNPAERQAYSELCAALRFEYRMEGQDPIAMELRPDLSIGEGSSYLHLTWMVESDKDDDIVLSIRNAKGPACFLRRNRDGVWCGRLLTFDRVTVELRAACPAVCLPDVCLT